MNEEKKLTSESSDDSAKKEQAINSASVKKEGNMNKELKSNNSKNLMGGVVIVVVLIGLMLIPFNSRTTLGRALDLFGMHKVAMKTDASINRDKGLSNLISHIDVSDEESFENSWDKIKDSNLKFEAVSMKSNFKVYPENEEFKDSLNASGDFAGNISLKDQKMSGDINLNINAELSKISEDYQDMSSNISAMGAIDNEKAYFKTDEMKFNLEGMNVSFGLDDWYSTPEFELYGEQKEALNEMAKLITELTETKFSKIISDETGRQLMKNGYGIYDKLEVGGVKNVEFGKENNEVTKKVRVVEIDLDSSKFEEKMKNFGENSFDSIDMLLNDQTLHSFVKNDFYDWFSRITPQAGILVKDEMLMYEVLTKEEFGEDFDEVITDFNENKSEIKEDFEEGFSEGMDGSVAFNDAVEIMEYTLYLEPGTNDYYGYKEKIKYNVPNEILDEIKSGNEELYSIVKNGIILEIEVYDMKLNDKVEPVEIPENSKSIEEFTKAMEDNEGTADFFNNLEMMMGQLMGLPSVNEEAMEEIKKEMETYEYENMKGMTPEEQAELEAMINSMK
ncbi:MAG: hypothetical protein KAT32_04335 [Candidatus Moranbacteria bacterium]|nr:hypothetical protein [Candidatus Moranbacteria bacterium]